MHLEADDGFVASGGNCRHKIGVLPPEIIAANRPSCTGDPLSAIDARPRQHRFQQLRQFIDELRPRYRKRRSRIARRTQRRRRSVPAKRQYARARRNRISNRRERVDAGGLQVKHDHGRTEGERIPHGIGRIGDHRREAKRLRRRANPRLEHQVWHDNRDGCAHVRMVPRRESPRRSHQGARTRSGFRSLERDSDGDNALGNSSGRAVKADAARDIHSHTSRRREATTSRGGEMANAADLKSAGRKTLWVRIPPPAPDHPPHIRQAKAMPRTSEL